jgi:hypothetical protein
MEKFIKDNTNNKLPMTDSDKSNSSSDNNSIMSKENDVIGIPEYYIGSKSKRIICHPMINKNKEAGKPFKVNAYNQFFDWKKRTYTLEQSRVITDHKGIGHLYFDANDSSTLAFDIDHEKKCMKCGGKMTIDARNFRDTTKKKTITAIWGIDSLPMMLLIIMGIMILIVLAFTFYLYSDNKTKDTTIAKLQAQIPQKESTTITNFILPLVINSIG